MVTEPAKPLFLSVGRSQIFTQSMWSSEINVLSERENPQNLIRKCVKSGGISPERKEKKNITVLPKITGRMKVVSYELSFDKSYWADGSCGAEHSKKLEPREVAGMQWKGRATVNRDLLTRQRKIVILVQFWRLEGLCQFKKLISWNINNPVGLYTSEEQKI